MNNNFVDANPIRVNGKNKLLNVFAMARFLLSSVWDSAPRLLIYVLINRLILSFIPLINVWITIKLIDSVTSLFKTNENLYISITYLVFQLFIMLFEKAVTAIDRLALLQLQQKTRYRLNDLIAQKASRISLLYFDQADFHDHLRRASSGQKGIEMIEIIVRIMQQSITLCSFMILLVQLHYFFLIAVLLLSVPSFVAYLYTGQLKFTQIFQQTPEARKESYLFGLLNGKEASGEIRVFGTDQYLRSIWHSVFWKNANEQFQLEKKSSKLFLWTDGINICALTGAIGVLIWHGTRVSFSIGQYMAYSQALLAIQNHIQVLTGNAARLFEYSLSANELYSFLQLPEEKRSTAFQAMPYPIQKGVFVDGLSFHYPGRQDPTLKNITFHVEAGKKVVIVGENGAGKTTLIKCLIGLYPVREGYIAFDDVDIKEIAEAELRKHISAIFQDYVKYQLTVRENIGFGDIEFLFDMAKMEAAASKGGADEVIKHLPQGFDMQLGSAFNGGRELSIGQWQKIALSRAFFKDSQIIILDEPTAALDPLVEAAVFEKFKMLTEGRTSFFISHRLGSCRLADHILVLKNGELVEQGNHEQLMALNQEYAKMFHMQAKWYQ
ncbi:ABC transporter ATP-binding protein [Paenibacillus sp. MBLB4367]|uniref:ABC transporter ATP-binding protein n=1 Tax=Paenibacillus sp. MBLB4367 TaxID=3384767 RepID=UPI00390820E6